MRASTLIVTVGLALWSVSPARIVAEATAAVGAAAYCDAKAPPAKFNFTLKDADNKPVPLASFKGKVVVLNFWATWCAPCKAEIPALVELQGRYGKQGLQILGVSTDDTAAKLKPFVTKLKMNYPVLQALDNEAILEAYGPMVVVPWTFLIGRDGNICTRHIGPVTKEAFEKEIKGLL